MNVEDTVRDFWATRPHRRATDRKIGGIAAAIGRRYGIDPVLVRVAFVVTTVFGGVGVLLYLLGWLLLPAEGDEVSAAESVLGRSRSSMSPALTVVLGLALLASVLVMLVGNAVGVVGLAVAAGALFLLHRSRAALGELPNAEAPSADAPSADALSADVPSTGVPSTAPATQPAVGINPATDRPAPPTWDPLGAAPFAWDLPEPTPVPPAAPPPPRRPRSKVTPITLGLALLTGGIALAFWPALSIATIAAIVLAVVGLGLVAGSLVRGGRGLILIAVPLALLTWVLQTVPESGFGGNEMRWAPVSTDQVQSRYELAAGTARLDLTGLRMTDEQTVRTSVTVGAGEVRVLLPPEVDAQVSCRVPVGDADCLGVTSTGVPARVDHDDPGPDGAGGGTLILDVRTGAGNVKVERPS